MSRFTWAFARHYVEMLLAMGVGMVVLYPLWQMAVHDAGPELDSLAMATTMSITMALWMRFRGHGGRPILEMTLAMYAGFVVLFPFLWSGIIDAGGLTIVGHVLMLVFMFLCMAARPDEYAWHGKEHA
ncbi:flagellar biosynthetic protein FliP [Herbihabitans rhizosphaerae]|uniref:Flagellar biosynthetic protein FliP n=1 Tax=Herbihabitans rhizosphaerae TaxID=1872711 RepID=A0A4Q7L8P7_9PSEU|nr:hypothetical protein [Herbihabitans rhizosphaerae]RZS45041.1 flagellar biosynthetic protein FliP [Herbihabitans rhizosphaerae]